MKKGFTLAEMLGVITLMAILAAIIYPNVASQYQKRTVELSSEKEKILCSIAKDYCMEKNITSCNNVKITDIEDKLPFDISDENGEIPDKYKKIVVNSYNTKNYSCDFK